MTAPADAAVRPFGSAPGAADAPRRRGPIDPRLWRYSATARGYLVLTLVTATINVAMIVVSALAIGAVLAGVLTTGTAELGEWRTELLVLAGAVTVRTLVTWVQSRFAHRSASRVVAELEHEVLAAATRLPPRELEPRRDEIATVLTRGLGGLSEYLTGYVPALLLAVTLTPITVVVIAFQDLTSAIIVVVTLPLIPAFMILIGLLTKGKADRTLQTMTTLSAQLLDLIAGLPTLRALGREQGPAEKVRELGDDHRRTTMSALRVAFLSGTVLEWLATLSVALIAVSIGLRLVYGDMALEAGVVALILAPEAYLPLRTVGAKFHAAEDGKAAAERAFTILDRAAATPSATAGAGFDATSAELTLTNLSVASRDGYAPHRLDAVCRPGAVTVLAGANGAGKSTALLAVLGLAEPAEGSVEVGGRPVTADDAWWEQVAWLPQRPVLLPGTLADNLRLTGVDLTTDGLEEICAATRFDEVLDELPGGWDTVVGAEGSGLSLGQRQRLALVRTLAADRPVLLLDEPTAHLDDATETTVLETVRELARRGRTVVIVAHRPSILAIADSVVRVVSDSGVRVVSDSGVRVVSDSGVRVVSHGDAAPGTGER
ncbi:thiol reductant ABC exporter subunit CydD [Rhodococcus ruber]|uniref:ABC transporter ATPase n=2 Tax=Rhodococcus ruber TaxID=1830 RepID=A0A098BQ99_9NOCA|nr:MULTISPECIES: thiol reductant ABC exporter subunit CydD [Rhodococcus]MCD2125619.1 thiol reductant ABC exporter subunit CydD [Rhodococcus ruber]MCZ1070404.1 thiol reductant ABC exporter subunit CydD [Rhodococcus sp. A5(2022)]MCZ4501816.1 thiol reductant ABC exporter subunit CydD [Rhodococcus ruber]MCZ4529131.1 thiol reductant ABC exporter subunit CydD [Rhodococcus ruber]MCZ4618918.1 thiol reductant ABC exporter subunit CydD [Rhodococcus ruber]